MTGTAALRVALAALFAVLCFAPEAKAQSSPTVIGTSCSAGTTRDNTYNSYLGCPSGTWAYNAVQVGASADTCAAATAGEIEWTGSAFQGCNGTSWGSLGGGGLTGSQYQVATFTATNTASGNANILTDASNDFIVSSGKVGIGTATPQATLHVNGGAIVANDAASCTSTNAGEIKYTGGTYSTCDGQGWVTLKPQVPGYFVLSKSTWNGNLGGIDGANAKCLTELTTNTGWMGYATANARGLLTSAHVIAYLCDTVMSAAGPCQSLEPMTTYAFANANNATDGGATFTTDGGGEAGGDSANWSGSTYFGGSYTYWTARYVYDNSNIRAGNISASGGGNGEGACTVGASSWTSSSAGDSGDSGQSNNTNINRWVVASPTCNNLQNLICAVNP